MTGLHLCLFAKYLLKRFGEMSQYFEMSLLRMMYEFNFVWFSFVWLLENIVKFSLEFTIPEIPRHWSTTITRNYSKHSGPKIYKLLFCNVQAQLNIARPVINVMAYVIPYGVFLAIVDRSWNVPGISHQWTVWTVIVAESLEDRLRSIRNISRIVQEPRNILPDGLFTTVLECSLAYRKFQLNVVQ